MKNKMTLSELRTAFAAGDERIDNPSGMDFHAWMQAEYGIDVDNLAGAESEYNFTL
jgi:hypothetical protein